MNTNIVTAEKILRRWGITASKVEQLLAKDDHQLDERINIIVEIHKLVYKKLGNPKAIKAFMAEPSHEAEWNGRQPRLMIASGSIDDLRDVLSFVEPK